MSLILKGIDLPKDKLISIDIYPDGSIYTGFPIPRNQVQAKAIQIPKGHGNIIDRNDIEIGRWDIDTDLAEQLLNAPIILESEENDERNT